MLLLTEQADVRCDHVNGKVAIQRSQNLVTIDGRAVLVEADPEGRKISGCPNALPGIKPCQLTLKVKQGYSDLIRIQGRRACLQNLQGLTEGTPPGTVHYVVRDAGQKWEWVHEVV